MHGKSVRDYRTSRLYSLHNIHGFTIVCKIYEDLFYIFFNVKKDAKHPYTGVQRQHEFAITSRFYCHDYKRPLWKVLYAQPVVPNLLGAQKGQDFLKALKIGQQFRFFAKSISSWLLKVSVLFCHFRQCQLKG